MRRGSGVLVVATLLLISGCDTPASGPAPAEGELHFLTYNVHGLPPAITGDDTAARMLEIAPLLGAFDVVGLQENFDDTNHQVLEDASPHLTQRRFAELLNEEKVYGSGLAVFADLLEVDYLHEHYRDCNGYVDAASDCLASKGFQALRLELAPGATVDVYNSHLEAGGGAEDNAARHENVTQLIEAMNGWSAGHSVVFLGDTNLHKSDPDDLPELERWIEETGLVDSCESVDCPDQNHIDRLFVRPGNGVSWEVLSWANESAFFGEEGTPLSDHPALSSRMRWEFVPTE